jgi:hypothetical protein
VERPTSGWRALSNLLRPVGYFESGEALNAPRIPITRDELGTVFRQNAGASHTILKEPSSNFPVRESYSALAFFRSNLILAEADNSHHKIPDREIILHTGALLR